MRRAKRAGVEWGESERTKVSLSGLLRNRRRGVAGTKIARISLRCETHLKELGANPRNQGRKDHYQTAGRLLVGAEEIVALSYADIPDCFMSTI